jgi:uridylate kinase
MPLLTPARSMLATVMNALQLQAALESVGVPVRVQTVRLSCLTALLF